MSEIGQPQAVTIEIPRPHPAQQEIIDQARRYNVLAIGRRFGKTSLGINRLLLPALQGYPVAWFAPTFKLLNEVWDDLFTRTQPVRKRVSRQDKVIELQTGGKIEFWSLDGDIVVRGRKYKRVVFDECAFVQNLEKVWNEAVRPTLADYSGDAWFLSTPLGLNYFYRLYLQGQDPLKRDWYSKQAPSFLNPYVPAEEFELMRQELTERAYQQEVLAQFLADGLLVFRHVDACASAQRLLVPTPGRRYVIGVDWGRADYCVIIVLDVKDRAMVAMERFNQLDYTTQGNVLKAMVDKWKPINVVAEENSIGEPIIEQLRRDKIYITAFRTTNASKMRIIDNLALHFEREAIAILDDPVLKGELKAFQPTRLPSGLIRYAAPEGQHDDTVMALALALEAIGSIDGVVEYLRERAIEVAQKKNDLEFLLRHAPELLPSEQPGSWEAGASPFAVPAGAF